MGNAATELDITIQYCMALPRHILQSAAFPRVTHARGSHDYGQSQEGNTEQWSSLGLTSLLYWALGLLPFKDDFWSEADQPGNHWRSSEADAELQTVRLSWRGRLRAGVGSGLALVCMRARWSLHSPRGLWGRLTSWNTRTRLVSCGPVEPTASFSNRCQSTCSPPRSPRALC